MERVRKPHTFLVKRKRSGASSKKAQKDDIKKDRKFAEKNFTDFVIKFADGKELKTHRFLLYDDSHYFRELLNKLEEKTELEMTAESKVSNFELMQEYIEFLYADLHTDAIIDFDIGKLLDIDEYIDSKKVKHIKLSNIPDDNILEFMAIQLNRIFSSNKVVENMKLLSDLLKFNINSIKIATAKNCINFINKLTDKALLHYFSTYSESGEGSYVYVILDNVGNSIEKMLENFDENKLRIVYYMILTGKHKYNFDNKIAIMKDYIQLDTKDFEYIYNLFPDTQRLMKYMKYMKKNDPEKN